MINPDTLTPDLRPDTNSDITEPTISDTDDLFGPISEYTGDTDDTEFTDLFAGISEAPSYSDEQIAKRLIGDIALTRGIDTAPTAEKEAVKNTMVAVGRAAAKAAKNADSHGRIWNFIDKMGINSAEQVAKDGWLVTKLRGDRKVRKTTRSEIAPTHESARNIELANAIKARIFLSVTEARSDTPETNHLDPSDPAVVDAYVAQVTKSTTGDADPTSHPTGAETASSKEVTKQLSWFEQLMLSYEEAKV